MNSGLYARPGFSATCMAAARASWLLLPSTKFANVKSGFRRPPICGSACSLFSRGSAAAASRRCRGHAPGAASRSRRPPRAKERAPVRPPARRSARAVLVHPVDDVAVRREQVQSTAVVHGLQRANPGVEMLGRQLFFEAAQALIPESRFHDRRPRKMTENAGKDGKGAGVYTGRQPVDILRRDENRRARKLTMGPSLRILAGPFSRPAQPACFRSRIRQIRSRP